MAVGRSLDLQPLIPLGFHLSDLASSYPPRLPLECCAVAPNAHDTSCWSPFSTRRGRARRRHVPSSASRVRRPCACPHCTSPRHHPLPPVIGLPRCSSRSTPRVQALDRSASALRCFPPRARAPPWQAALAWHHHLPSPATSLPRLVPAARAVCRISPPGTGSSASSLAACRAVCSNNLRPRRSKPEGGWRFDLSCDLRLISG